MCPPDLGAPAALLLEADGVLEQMAALANSRLVRQERASGGEERFSMREMVREYAGQRQTRVGAYSEALALYEEGRGVATVPHSRIT